MEKHFCVLSLKEHPTGEGYLESKEIFTKTLDALRYVLVYYINRESRCLFDVCFLYYFKEVLIIHK